MAWWCFCWLESRPPLNTHQTKPGFGEKIHFGGPYGGYLLLGEGPNQPMLGSRRSFQSFYKQNSKMLRLVEGKVKSSRHNLKPKFMWNLWYMTYTHNTIYIWHIYIYIIIYHPYPIENSSNPDLISWGSINFGAKKRRRFGGNLAAPRFCW